MTLGNVRPYLSIGDVRNGFAGYPILNGKVSLASTIRKTLSNFCNLLIGQLGIAVTFTSWLPTFGYFVVHIVLMSAKPKMRGIYTGWIVPVRAIMANQQIVRNIAKVDDVGYARGVMAFALPRATAITTIHFAPLPYPTIIWRALINFFPEAISVVFAILMPDKIARWLTLHPSHRQVSNFGDTCLLSTAAHAESARIWRWQVDMDSAVMASQESKVLSFFCASSMIALLSNVGRLAATTLASAVSEMQSKLGYPLWIIFEIVGEVRFDLLKLWGSILHSSVSLSDLLTPADGSNRRAGNYLPTSSIPQEAAL